MLDARRLRILATLERLGTIAAVAKEVHVTAPGISMQISALEREVGLPLTERRGRRLSLTPAGRVLASHGRDIANRLSLAELDVESLLRGVVGSYRVAAFPTAARTFVADVWTKVLRDEPVLDLRITTPEPEVALSALLTGSTDLAVIHSYSNVPRQVPGEVQSTLIATEPVWIALPREASPSPVGEMDVRELAERPWVTPTSELTCFEMVDRACGLAGFRPNVVAETMDYSVQLQLVGSGAGVALIPQLAAQDVPAGVRLVRSNQELKRHIFVAHRASMASDPGLARLSELMRSAAKSRLQHAHSDG